FVLILQQTLLLGCILFGVTQGIKQQEKWVITASGATLYSSLSLILGKLLANLSVYSVLFLFYMLCIPYFYDLSRLCNLSDLIAVGLPFLLAVALLGLCGSFLVKRIESVFILLLPLGIPLFFLSGISWPTEAMSPFIQQFAQIIPSTSGIEALVRVNQMG